MALDFKWNLSKEEKEIIRSWLELDRSFVGLAFLKSKTFSVPVLSVFSDASDFGMGAVIRSNSGSNPTVTFSARLPSEAVGSLSAYREMFAMFSTIKAFAVHIASYSVYGTIIKRRLRFWGKEALSSTYKVYPYEYEIFVTA